MSNVVIDTEKLAHGLEVGIGHTRTVFERIAEPRRLRSGCCGLVSAAIYEYAKHEDIPAQLLVSKPALPFDEELQHVFVAVGEAGESQRIVDASYSQFLGHVGLNLGYIEAFGEDIYPPQKILDFEISESDVVFDWLTDISVIFREDYPQIVDGRYGTILGEGPLSQEPASAIRAAFEAIWNPSQWEAWPSSPHVIEQARIVSEHIPSGVITIVS